MIIESMSFWEHQALIADVDYFIIGGGIVGYSAAISIKEMARDAKVVVIDKNDLPSGASTRNAGFACFGSVSEIVADIQSFGEDLALDLVDLRLRGLNLLLRRLDKKSIEYSLSKGYEIFKDKDQLDYYLSFLPELNEKFEERFGLKDVYRLGSGYFGSEIINQYEGCLNPYKMMHQLDVYARSIGVCVLKGVEVKSINYFEKSITSSHGSFDFNRLIVANNGSAKQLIEDVDVMPARNHVFMIKPEDPLNWKGCYHLDKGFIYFRDYHDYVLIGGARNLDAENESTGSFETNPFITNHLHCVIKDVLKINRYKLISSWVGHLGIGQTKQPIIKKVSDGVYCSVRMGGMGVAIGSAVGEEVAHLALKQ